MDIVTPVATSVYLYYDRSDLLLYVGITSRAAVRNREHNASKEWWRWVERQDVEHYSSRELAVARERGLIRKFHPPFNTHHNPDHAAVRASYLAARQSGAVIAGASPKDARTALGRLCHKLPLERCTIGGQVRSATTAYFKASKAHGALAGCLRWSPPVLLLAPRKIGFLTGVETAGNQTIFEFQSHKPIPLLTDVQMNLKVRSRNPFIIEIHEVRAARPPDLPST